MDPLLGLPVKLPVNTWLATTLQKGLAFGGFTVGLKLDLRMPMGDLPYSRLAKEHSFLSMAGMRSYTP